MDFDACSLVRAVLQIASAVLAAVALAHVLELPGKLRLSHDGYLIVQSIYYPGFTIAGATEPLAAVSTLGLALATRGASSGFWLAVAAFACFADMQAIFWIVVQPINKRWLEGKQQLTGASATFFSVGGRREGTWEDLRDRREYAHATRAALAILGLVALLVGMKALVASPVPAAGCRAADASMVRHGCRRGALGVAQ